MTATKRLALIASMVGALAVASVSMAQNAAPQGSDVRKLEYVLYSPGYTSVITSIPSPAGACAGGVAMKTARYSCFFRANEDDNTVFQGLDYGFFSGFRARQSLRDIVNLKPGAGQKFSDFERMSRQSTTLGNVTGGLLVGSLLSIAAIFPLLKAYDGKPKEQGNAAIVVLCTSLGFYVAARITKVAQETRRARAFQRLLDAVNAYNE